MGIFELYSLLVIMLVAKVFYTSIRSLCQQTGTAAWQASLVSQLGALLALWVLYCLWRKWPGMDLPAIVRQVFGKGAATLLSVIWTGFGVFYCAVTFREIGELLKTYHLQNTALWMLVGIFAAVAVFLSWQGVVHLGRLAALCFWPVLAGIVAILLLCIPQYHPVNLAPWLGYGVGNTLSYGVQRISAYGGELWVLFNIAHMVRDEHVLKRAGLAALGTGSVLITGSILCYTMAFSYEISGISLSPILQMIKQVYFGRFFQRFEAIFLFVFVILAILCISTYLYTTAHLCASALHLRHVRYAVLPVGLLSFWGAMLPVDMAQVMQVYLAFLRQHSGWMTMVAPVVVLLLARWWSRRKKVAGNER